MNCAACGKSLSDDARDKIFRVGNKNVCSVKCLKPELIEKAVQEIKATQRTCPVCHQIRDGKGGYCRWHMVLGIDKETVDFAKKLFGLRSMKKIGEA